MYCKSGGMANYICWYLVGYYGSCMASSAEKFERPWTGVRQLCSNRNFKNVTRNNINSSSHNNNNHCVLRGHSVLERGAFTREKRYLPYFWGGGCLKLRLLPISRYPALLLYDTTPRGTQTLQATITTTRQLSWKRVHRCILPVGPPIPGRAIGGPTDA